MLFAGLITLSVHSQATYYGTGAGSGGYGNTSVGYYAGHDITGSYNSNFGLYAGRKTTTGYGNAFAGAYSGYNTTTGSSNTFFGGFSGRDNISGSYNTYLGGYAGYSAESGRHNIFIGYSTGANNSADNNVFIGNYTGNKNLTGYANLFLGGNSGAYNTTGSANVYLGNMAGYTGVDGQLNVFIGYETGREAAGSANVFVGAHAGYETQGENNTFVGTNAGRNTTTGYRNLYMGNSAGHSNISGIKNVYLGFHAGSTNTAGSGNVFLGYNAGYYETGSNKFYVANDFTNTLLYGDFTTRNLSVGAVVTSSYKLYVSGDAYATGVWLSSDKKWKTKEKQIAGALATINQLEPKSYEFKESKTAKSLSFSEGKHYGFIAQDLQNVMPELVRQDEDGSLAINYIEIIPLLVQAIQEMDQKQQRINSYEEKINSLEAQIKEIKQLLAYSSSLPPVEGEMKVAENQSMEIFPNPSTGNMTVRYQVSENAGEIKLMLFDIQGKWQKTIYNLAPGKSEVTIQKLGLPAGMYNFTLIEDDQIKSSSRVIIE